MAWLEIIVKTAADTVEDMAAALTAGGFPELVIEDQAEFEASILMDDDTMEMIRLYRGLNDEQKAALKQMARVSSKINASFRDEVKG